ncbi:hypothetical protein F2P81_019503 [Scophthalmus maximus]|uniref:Uncharacterized protein n=1 Tax=Scophthalmus maximus TaxID=52904 RepID=A0A6A4RZR2_SCOMX|nr:hypothetical protein F2P81_019503 [Scophthalmus maximus]
MEANNFSLMLLHLPDKHKKFEELGRRRPLRSQCEGATASPPAKRCPCPRRCPPPERRPCHKLFAFAVVWPLNRAAARAKQSTHCFSHGLKTGSVSSPFSPKDVSDVEIGDCAAAQLAARPLLDARSKGKRSFSGVPKICGFNSWPANTWFSFLMKKKSNSAAASPAFAVCKTRELLQKGKTLPVRQRTTPIQTVGRRGPQMSKSRIPWPYTHGPNDAERRSHFVRDAASVFADTSRKRTCKDKSCLIANVRSLLVG